jgi:hypothetical protein
VGIALHHCGLFSQANNAVYYQAAAFQATQDDVAAFQPAWLGVFYLNNIIIPNERAHAAATRPKTQAEASAEHVDCQGFKFA